MGESLRGGHEKAIQLSRLMQLPFSQEELDEFVTPEGEVFYSFRSIVYDSWLVWSDALPDVFEQRQELTQDTYDNIICLADSLHVFHQSLPDYRSLRETPSESRWWDPTSATNAGMQECGFFSIKEYTATDGSDDSKENRPAVTPVPDTSKLIYPMSDLYWI